MRKAHRSGLTESLKMILIQTIFSPYKMIQSLHPALPMKDNIVVPVELEME